MGTEVPLHGEGHVTVFDVEHDETLLRTQFLENKNTRINTLPAELLASIFAHCLDDKALVFGLTNVVSISHVCEHWREIALSTAVLWSTITSAYPQWVPVMLKRSQGASLCIDLDFNMIINNTSLTVLKSVLQELHRSRILRVTSLSSQWISLHQSDFDAPARALEEIIVECFRPSLRPGLDTLGTCLPESLFLNEGHRLRRLTLIACAIKWDLTSLYSLQILELQDIPSDIAPSYEQLFSFLANTPSLRRLALRNALPIVVPGATVVKLSEQTVSLPCLESLRIDQEAFPIHWLLEHLEIPITAKRVLKCTFISRQTHIINLLEQLQQLVQGLGTSTRAFWFQVSAGLGVITIATSNKQTILTSLSDADFQVTWRVPVDVNGVDDLMNQYISNVLQGYFTEVLSNVCWLTLSTRRRQLQWPRIFDTCSLRRIIFDRSGAVAMAPSAVHVDHELSTLDSLEAQAAAVTESQQRPSFPDLAALEFSRADLADIAPRLVEELQARERSGLKLPVVRLWKSAGFDNEHVAMLRALYPSFEVYNIYSMGILRG